MSDNLTGTHFLDQPVVVDGNCITSQAQRPPWNSP